jgi:hypothetical protein
MNVTLDHFVMVRIHVIQLVRSEELTYILKTAARSVLLATFIVRGARRSCATH